MPLIKSLNEVLHRTNDVDNYHLRRTDIGQLKTIIFLDYAFSLRNTIFGQLKNIQRIIPLPTDHDANSLHKSNSKEHGRIRCCCGTK